jgi:hypothetical protein
MAEQLATWAMTVTINKTSFFCYFYKFAVCTPIRKSIGQTSEHLLITLAGILVILG